MLILEKLNIYIKYHGDIDSWSCSQEDSAKISSKDWYLIAGLLQDIKIAKEGQASENFINNLNLRIKENCENIDAVKLLMKMAQ